jgi:hypothetical protein
MLINNNVHQRSTEPKVSGSSPLGCTGDARASPLCFWPLVLTDFHKSRKIPSVLEQSVSFERPPARAVNLRWVAAFHFHFGLESIYLDR